MSDLIINSYSNADLSSASLLDDLKNADILKFNASAEQAKLLTKSWDRFDSYKTAYAQKQTLKGLFHYLSWKSADIYTSFLNSNLNKINELYYSVGKTVFPVHFEKNNGNYHIWFCKRPKESEKRFKVTRFLAEKGNVEAECSLGTLYIDGIGTDVSYSDAMIWFKKAAEKGYAEAQYGVGWLYIEGKGLERNDKEALYWMREAAKNGHKKAKEILTSIGKNQ